RYADAYRRTGRTTDADRELARVEEALKRAIVDPRSNARSLNSLAWYAATSGVALVDALRAADRAATLEPGNAEILDTVAECHYRRGEFAQAIVAGRQALALSPTDAYRKSQLKKFEDAAKHRGKDQEKSDP